MKTILTLISFLLLALFWGCQTAQPTAPAVSDSSLSVPAGSTGNPPLIPHDVAADEGGDTCLGCHRDGDNGAPKTEHPQYVDCRQCHIPGTGDVKPFSTSY
ncbi:hypothetical protein [Geothermobacter hydrogeniphilus]|uniref:hypothetical protein n=1 Tax=Geothermobacter hydrogeniphilus TaxID=1969733 RepID=UPI0011AEE10C|nr:hypothetical protein [Geothermobacter hydrogeniphilus]